MAYQSHHCSATLLCSPVSVSLCLHLLVLYDLLLFSTSAPQPSFTISAMHLCSLLLLHFMLCILFLFSELRLFCVFQLLPTTSISPCVIPLYSSTHLFFFLHSYSLCAPCASHMRNASACSSCRVLCLIIIATL
jgi:hypothetical protein